MPEGENLGKAELKLTTDPKGVAAGLKGALQKTKVFAEQWKGLGGKAGKNLGLAMAKGISRQLKGLGNKIDKQLTAELGGKMSSLGKTMSIGLTAPLVAFGALTLKTAADFESGMNKVEAVSGATGVEMGKLTGLAKELGSTTQFSASQAAGGMAFLSQAGFKANETISAMPGLLALAAAGSLELAEAADIASNIISGFGESASEASRVADVLAQTAASSNTSVTQLGQAMSFVAPVAKGVGLSIEETAAMIGKLGDAGIQSTRAGTGLRGMIAALVKPSTEAQQVLDKLGVSVNDSTGKMRPLADILGELGEKNDGFDAAANMVQIFGREVQASAMVLSGVGKEGLDQFTVSLENAEGAAGTMAKTMMKGLKGALTEFKSAMEGLFIAMGDSGLLDIVERLTDGVTKAVQWMSKLPAPVLAAGVAIATLAAVIGPLLIVMGLVVAKIAAAGGVMALLTAGLAVLVSPIGLVVAGVVAVVAVFVIWNDEIMNFVKGITVFLTSSETVNSVVRAIGDAVKWTWDIFVDFVSWLFGPLIKGISAVLGWFGDMIEAIHDVGEEANKTEKAEKELAAQMKKSEEVYNDTAEAQEELADQMKKAEKHYKRLEKEADDLADTTGALYGEVEDLGRCDRRRGGTYPQGTGSNSKGRK